MKKAYLMPAIMIGAGLTVLFTMAPVRIYLGLLTVSICFPLSLLLLTSERIFSSQIPPIESREAYIPLGLCYGILICLQLLTTVTNLNTLVVAFTAMLAPAGLGRVHHVISQGSKVMNQAQNRNNLQMWRILAGLTPLLLCVILSSGRNVFLSSQFLTWIPVVSGIFVLLFAKRVHLSPSGSWGTLLSEHGVIAAGGLSATILFLLGLFQKDMSGPAAAGMLVCTFYTMVTAVWVRHQLPVRPNAEYMAASHSGTLTKAGMALCLFPCLALGTVIQAL